MNRISLVSLSFILLMSLQSLVANVTEIKGEQQFNSMVIQSGQPVVVKVFATWCGPCRNSTRPFEELSQEFSNVTFVAVDIDKNGFIKKYASSLPTFLVFKDGRVVSKDEGFTSKDSWRNLISRSVGTAAASQDDGKKKPGLSVADQAAQADSQVSEPDTTVKGSACLASQSYLTNAYNAVRDFFVNIGNTVQSWFK